MIKTNEEGFSLLEVSVAVAIMVALSGLGFTIASTVNEGNGDKSSIYERDGQTNIDYAECAAARITDSAMACVAVEDLYAPSVGSNGVTAIWNGAELTYSINASICNLDNSSVSYYYNNSSNGSNLMNTDPAGGSYYPSLNGYGLGTDLGFGTSISSYYVVVSCNGISARSDNDVS